LIPGITTTATFATAEVLQVLVVSTTATTAAYRKHIDRKSIKFITQNR
jgi:hypothetical protein